FAPPRRRASRQRITELALDLIRRPTSLRERPRSNKAKARLRRSSNRSALPLGLGTGVFLLYLLFHYLCRSQALEERGVAPGKKNAARLGAHIVFADESGFLLIPTVVRTWAPQGETPIHRHRQGRRDKLSVISGISVSPKRRRLSLYYLLFFENIGQEEVCVFLRELLRHLRGPIIVLLDNSSTHKGEPLEKLRARHPR